MKKELKTTIFDTVIILRRLFVKRLDINVSYVRKMTEMGKQETKTNAARGEGTDRTNNYKAEPSSVTARNPPGQPERKVAPPGEGKAKLYSEVVQGKTTQKTFKVTVASRDKQTADTIIEVLKSKINPTEMNVGIRSIKTLRDGKVQLETGSIQEAEDLMNSIRDNIGDAMETNIQKPIKPRLKIHNIPEEITTDNIEATLIAQNPDIGLEKVEIAPNAVMKQKGKPAT
jgi:hypothetical protein